MIPPQASSTSKAYLGLNKAKDYTLKPAFVYGKSAKALEAAAAAATTTWFLEDERSSGTNQAHSNNSEDNKSRRWRELHLEKKAHKNFNVATIALMFVAKVVTRERESGRVKECCSCCCFQLLLLFVCTLPFCFLLTYPT